MKRAENTNNFQTFVSFLLYLVHGSAIPGAQEPSAASLPLSEEDHSALTSKVILLHFPTHSPAILVEINSNGSEQRRHSEVVHLSNAKSSWKFGEDPQMPHQSHSRDRV